jgi:allophanate hydrolase
MTSTIHIAVCGAHMSDLPLNHQLTDIGGKLVTQTTTAPYYNLYKITSFTPPRPGLLRVSNGLPIVLEIWEIPLDHYGAFVAEIAAPLGIGTIEMADGSRVQGFVCEAYATVNAENISHHGGWRGYLAQA